MADNKRLYSSFMRSKGTAGMTAVEKAELIVQREPLLARRPRDSKGRLAGILIWSN
ncbi:MAG: hypothetical protein K0Q63_3716 [Paenibacillus sp.]|nr:hypothetical protein [Paenibacillus sp.]